MSYLIYCYTNRTSTKRYIGYTKLSIDKRWKVHQKLVKRGSCLHFHNAIRKYGVDDWDHDVICDQVLTLDEAKLLERHYIEMLGTYENGYNMTLGGDGCPPGIQKGRIFTPEHREKLRQAKLGTKTGRKIPPQMAESRRKLKGTQSPRDAAKLGWARRKQLLC